MVYYQGVKSTYFYCSFHVSHSLFFLSLSFPEIPLFHVLNARVTFGNIFGSVSSANFVTLIREPTMSCVVDEQCFEAPPTYHQSGEDDIINNNDGPFSGVFTIASM